MSAIEILKQKVETIENKLDLMSRSKSPSSVSFGTSVTNEDEVKGLVLALEGLSIRLELMEQSMNALLDRVASLEEKPEPEAVDLAPLEARVVALEEKPEGEVVDLAPLEARVVALEEKPEPEAVDLAPLEARVVALENHQHEPLFSLEARVACLEEKPTPVVVDLAPLEARVAALEDAE